MRLHRLMDHFAGLNHKATSQALNDKLTKMANNHCKSHHMKPPDCLLTSRPLSARGSAHEAKQCAVNLQPLNTMKPSRSAPSSGQWLCCSLFTQNAHSWP